MPPLKTAAAMDLENIRPYLLDSREEYPEPFYLLEYNGVPFSPLGGIQAVTGQKKNGKSFLITQLMAAILGGGCKRMEEYLPGLKVPERTIEHIGHPPTVLYVDTEMEKLNSAKVKRRVHWLCDWPLNENNDRFHVLWLRAVEAEENLPAFKKRYQLILQAERYLKPDIIFIDGTRDIIGDFNDNEESSALVNELMANAQSKNICIWNALHLNPRPGSDEVSKMRGHLGTELGNKVSDTFCCVKEKSSKGVNFTVKQLDARGKDVDDWTFQVVDDAGALGVPKITNIPVDSTLDEDIIRALKEILPNGKSLLWSRIRSELVKLTELNKDMANKVIDIAVKDNALRTIRIGNDRYYTFNKDYDKPF